MRVIDTCLTFATRCANCGRIEFHPISLFQLLMDNEIDFKCECGSVDMTVSLRNNKVMSVVIPCLACDIKHTYIYDLNGLLKRQLSIICCIETGLELCFFGKDKDVKDIVSQYKEDLNTLLGELGLQTDSVISKKMD